MFMRTATYNRTLHRARAQMTITSIPACARNNVKLTRVLLTQPAQNDTKLSCTAQLRVSAQQNLTKSPLHTTGRLMEHYSAQLCAHSCL